ILKLGGLGYLPENLALLLTSCEEGAQLVPPDVAPCAGAADECLELGEPDLAAAFKWMLRKGKAPTKDTRYSSRGYWLLDDFPSWLAGQAQLHGSYLDAVLALAAAMREIRESFGDEIKEVVHA